MITDGDIEKLTKSLENRFATKDDIKNFVTKKELNKSLEPYATKNDLNSLEARMDDKIERMTNKLALHVTDAMNIVLETLGTKIDKLEDRMGKLEVRMDNIEVRMDKIEFRMGNLESRMGHVEKELKGICTRLNVLEESVREIPLHRSLLRSHEQRIERIELEYWTA